MKLEMAIPAHVAAKSPCRLGFAARLCVGARSGERQAQWPRPQTWLADAIDCMAKGHPVNQIDELLSWNRHNQSAPASPRNYRCSPQLTLTKGARKTS
jgi:hypothetical protein